MGSPWGTAAEEGARRLAAELGVKDFVYDPVVVRKGRGTREVSDGMLIVGEKGLVLQVKSRNPSVADSDERLEAWVVKNVTDAVRQVIGTLRTLRGSPQEVLSHRGHKRNTESVSSWSGVVLLDLKRVPEGLQLSCLDSDIVVMTLSDWYALHHMVLSTSAVIDYVSRVVVAGVAVVLGLEKDRYFEIAAADAKVVRYTDGLPSLPEVLIEGRDRFYVDLLSEWIDSDIAVAAFDPTPDNSDHTRRAVEVIDSIPVLLRSDIGRHLHSNAVESAETREVRSGTFLVSGTSDRLVFHTSVVENWRDLEEDLTAFLLRFVSVRHEQLDEIHGNGATLLLSRVALEGTESMRTVALCVGGVDGLHIIPESRWDIYQKYGVLTPGGPRDVKSLGRNERCPCRTGMKVKKCNHRSL